MTTPFIFLKSLMDGGGAELFARCFLDGGATDQGSAVASLSDLGGGVRAQALENCERVFADCKVEQPLPSRSPAGSWCLLCATT